MPKPGAVSQRLAMADPETRNTNSAIGWRIAKDQLVDALAQRGLDYDRHLA
jgi:hypothetical protein